ncbi:MAG: hypothetical protein ABIK07_14165 [Planctomycetota bacterium]
MSAFPLMWAAWFTNLANVSAKRCFSVKNIDAQKFDFKIGITAQLMPPLQGLYRGEGNGIDAD